MRCTFAILMLLALAAAGCGDEEEAEPGCGEPAEDYVVDADAVGHTCEHVTGGPFGDLSAAAPGASDGPLLENEHMFYTVTLVDDGSGSYAGTLTLRPAFSGTYVLNLSEELPVEVVAADDQSAPCHAASQSLEGCAGLAYADLYTLEDKRTYVVRLGPTASPTIDVVFEEHIIAAN